MTIKRNTTLLIKGLFCKESTLIYYLPHPKVTGTLSIYQPDSHQKQAISQLFFLSIHLNVLSSLSFLFSCYPCLTSAYLPGYHQMGGRAWVTQSTSAASHPDPAVSYMTVLSLTWHLEFMMCLRTKGGLMLVWVCMATLCLRCFVVEILVSDNWCVMGMRC